MLQLEWRHEYHGCLCWSYLELRKAIAAKKSVLTIELRTHATSYLKILKPWECLSWLTHMLNPSAISQVHKNNEDAICAVVSEALVHSRRLVLRRTTLTRLRTRSAATNLYRIRSGHFLSLAVKADDLVPWQMHGSGVSLIWKVFLKHGVKHSKHHETGSWVRSFPSFDLAQPSRA